MYQIRQFENEYIIGHVSSYSGLFTCYDVFKTLNDAIKNIKKFSKQYSIAL